jgi:hypothetical protein
MQASGLPIGTLGGFLGDFRQQKERNGWVGCYPSPAVSPPLTCSIPQTDKMSNRGGNENGWGGDTSEPAVSPPFWAEQFECPSSLSVRAVGDGFPCRSGFSWHLALGTSLSVRAVGDGFPCSNLVLSAISGRTLHGKAVKCKYS